MTTRYEGAGAAESRVWVAKAGEEVGDDIVPQGQLYVCISYDEVFALSGTPTELRVLLTEALNKINEAEHE